MNWYLHKFKAFCNALFKIGILAHFRYCSKTCRTRTPTTLTSCAAWSFPMRPVLRSQPAAKTRLAFFGSLMSSPRQSSSAEKLEPSSTVAAASCSLPTRSPRRKTFTSFNTCGQLALGRPMSWELPSLFNSGNPKPKSCAQSKRYEALVSCLKAYLIPSSWWSFQSDSEFMMVKTATAVASGQFSDKIGNLQNEKEQLQVNPNHWFRTCFSIKIPPFFNR